MPFEQDQNGQWWYTARNGYRSRAYLQDCEKCGKPFPALKTDHVRFCSHRCHLLRGGHPNWRGGRTMQKGYVLVRVVDEDPISIAMGSQRGYVAEHRLVLARSLGRPLLSSEHVHHINGIKTDNRIENLELLHRPHGPGVVLACKNCGSRDVGPVPLRRKATQ